MSKLRRRAAIALALVTVAATAGPASAASVTSIAFGSGETSAAPLEMMVMCGKGC